MIHIEAANAFAANTFLSGCYSEWKVHLQLINNGVATAPQLSNETRIWFLKSLERIRDIAHELEMVASRAAADRAFEECLELFSKKRTFGVIDLQALMSHADRVVHVFGDELRPRLVFVIPSKHAAFYSNKTHFGEEVETAFPSATYDVGEAAKCRAIGRWTACVMHIMRALEVGMRALAIRFGVETDGNWNTILNQIEAEIRTVSKKTDGKEAEQWAAEAATHLRFIKNAWRNHAMHPLEKYDEDRAVAIFDNARSFMCHLATQLSE